MRIYTCLTTFIYPHESLVLQSIFEKEAIDFYLENETLVSLIPFSSYAFGGIKLMVHSNHFSKAKQILDNLKDNSSNLHIV